MHGGEVRCEKFEEDLDLMEKSGANSYRFSIEWSQIEPQQGTFDPVVLKKYLEMIVACKKRRLEPMVTLYHFNEPLWFTKLGSFEKEKNITYFVNFCKNMFNHYSHLVNFWCTINEPAIQAFSGYLYGQFPPHKHNLQTTVDVLTNLLKAHTAAYKELKQCVNGIKAHIGIVHNLLKFLPRYSWEPIELILTKFLTQITNNLVMNFLKTGRIDYHVKWMAYKQYYDSSAIHAFDFIGLNFYANPVVGFNKSNFFGPTRFPGQELSDMSLPIDPRGFENAIDDFSALGKPIYITEVGIADHTDKLRTKFLILYLDVVQKKRKEGIDIRGCYHWTFADNYEWNEGYTQHFGLFTQHRTKRPSSEIYEVFMLENKHPVQEKIQLKA